jgi:hypothetical protein
MCQKLKKKRRQEEEEETKKKEEEVEEDCSLASPCFYFIQLVNTALAVHTVTCTSEVTP